jgi:hypothetical protein
VNDFQLSLASFLLKTLSNRDLGDIHVAVSKGTETLVEVKPQAVDASFWLYDDGASIFGSHVDDRFEIASFRNLDELGEKYMARVEQFLESQPMPTS